MGVREHIVIACVSGKGQVTVRGRDWEVMPGDIAFLPPGEGHCYRADRLAPWSILWFHFRGDRAGDYLEMVGVSSAQVLVSVNDTTPLVEAFEAVFQHVVDGFGDAALVGLATGFSRWLGLVRVLRRAPGSRPLINENRILQSLALVRDDPGKPWTVEEMAREASLSVPHFTVLCRRQTGMPPLAYLIRLRLQLALDLLQKGQHNVEEVARMVGYADPFYFSRLFRKHIGHPPSTCLRGP